MSTVLPSKGQVTIPKRIRDELQLLPGTPVDFSVNAAGEVVLQAARAAKSARRKAPKTVSTRRVAAPTCAGAPTN